jgi:hypothetical protein
MDVFQGFGTTADAKGNVIYSGQWVLGRTEAEHNALQASVRAYEASGGPARHEAYEAEKHARKMQEIDAAENQANQDAANRAWANDPMNPANGYMRGQW